MLGTLSLTGKFPILKTLILMEKFHVPGILIFTRKFPVLGALSLTGKFPVLGTLTLTEKFPVSGTLIFTRKSPVLGTLSLTENSLYWGLWVWQKIILNLLLHLKREFPVLCTGDFDFDKKFSVFLLTLSFFTLFFDFEFFLTLF